MALDTENMLAFEGAQGFGAYTQGGRGGEIVTVTNLKDSGEGSLRWALEDLDYPRIVVFDVGGIIKLSDQIEVNGNVTVAGQTAPGGITVTGARLRVVESEVIIRGLHIRPGDDVNGDDPDNRDGISVGKGDTAIKNVIIDSNSLSWSIDETLTSWGNNTNITFSNNIISEALEASLHSKGDHSKAMLIGDGSSQVSIIGNLFAHNNFRNALVKDGSHDIEFINNVVYNYGDQGFTAHGDSTAHVINNVFIAGDNSFGKEPIRFEKSTNGASYYEANNIGRVTQSSDIQNKYVFNPATTDIIDTSDVLKTVLSNVGATAGGRDAIDARVVETVLTGTGRIIDSQDDVGGYLKPSGQAALTDTDKDGIPDAYEAKLGSDANVADAHKDADGNGRANIEDYINGLLDGFATTSPAPTNAGPVQAPVADDAGPQQDPNIIVQPVAHAPAPTPTEPVVAQPQVDVAVSDRLTIVEAEAMQLSGGFEVRNLSAASDAKVIQVGRDEMGQADLDFEGNAGRYNLSIDYFDENDGISQMKVQVNGETVANWAWDENLGDYRANKDTLTSKVISDLDLKPGDKISVIGTSDGREPLRVDKLMFEHLDAPAPSTNDVATQKPPQTLRVEAEDFDLLGFREANLKAADNGKVIMRDGSGAHSANLDFDGISGIYDISIEYFDEADGESELTLAINGKVVENWIWDEELGSNLANKSTAMTHVIENIEINSGDRISLIGLDDAREPLRIDAVDFIADDMAFLG